ncbi:MAG: GntR family transcriptional regulator [Lachnospiraceae bacterium]|nr:GntR family transcriptional regulator [Lachnospiraceae bacterium]
MARTSKSKSASRETYNALREDIIYKRIPSGESLVEDDLAVKYNVSRTPIREALKWLENDGLVIYYPYRGCFVKTFTERDVVEIYTVRKALEGICCGTAAGIITDYNISLLEENQKKSVEAYENGDIPLANRLGDNLHKVILEISGNTQIQKILDQLKGQQEYFGSITSKMKGRMLKSLNEHEQILAALKAHDAKAAEEAMRAHMDSTMEDMLQEARNARVEL